MLHKIWYYLFSDTALAPQTRDVSQWPDLSWHHRARTTLTQWGRMAHISVSNFTIIGSDNGLSPGRRQAIIWTDAGILLIRILGANFSEILSEILTFSLKKMHFKISSAKWRQFCLGLNVLSRVTSVAWVSRTLLVSWQRCYVGTLYLDIHILARLQ